MTRRSLIIIDLLNDYLDRWDAKKADDLIRHTNRLAKAFREAGLPVIWVGQSFKPDLSDAFLEMRDNGIHVVIEGARGAEFHSGLDRQAGDITIIKKRYSAFFGTALEDILARGGVDEVTLCGINTHACIRMTAIDAYQRDIRVVLAEECIDSYNKEHAQVSLNYMNGKIARLVPVADIVETIERAA